MISKIKVLNYNFILGIKYIKYLFKIIDWVVFIVLGILALISVEESIDAYSNEKTSWAIEMQPIQKQPTLSICFALSHVSGHDMPSRNTGVRGYHFLYGIDFNISVTTSSNRY